MPILEHGFTVLLPVLFLSRFPIVCLQVVVAASAQLILHAETTDSIPTSYGELYSKSEMVSGRKVIYAHVHLRLINTFRLYI